MKLDIIIGVLFIVVLIGIFSVFLLTMDNTDIKLVDCYDSYDNKIVGMVCEEEVLVYNFPLVILFVLIFVLFLCFLIL